MSGAVNEPLALAFYAGLRRHPRRQPQDLAQHGIRLDAYGHEPAELTGAIDRLLADGALRERLAATARRLQGARGTEVAAAAIERVARGAPAAAR